jgi:ribonucleotide reductase beta subunit family protein with ferritin-like domain
MDEPLLTESKNRHVMFPLEYPDIFEMYKKHVSTFWTADELNFHQDMLDLEKLSMNEKYFIYHILAFFAASDGIVSENLSQRFANDVPKAEVRAFYAFQNAIEQVHSESYSLLIDSYVKDPVEKDKLFNAVSNFPAIKEKSDWCLKWVSDEKAPFSQRLVAFAIVEGVFFSASFCAIFWMRERGLLPGLSFANQLISRDEGLHTQFACLLYSKLQHKLNEDVIYAIFEEAVQIEMKFITESIPCAMIGMNEELMKEYIRFVADYTLIMLGYTPLYNASNPFGFMEFAGLEGKTNFFEKRVSEYSKVSSKGEGVPDVIRVDIDCDF